MRASQRHDREVGALSDLDRTDFGIDVQRAGRPDRREIEDRLRGHRPRVPPCRLVEQGGDLHVREKVHRVVRDRRVRSEAHVNPLLEHFGNRGHAAAREFHVRHRTMPHADAMPREGSYLVDRRPYGMGCGEAGLQESDLLEPLDRPEPGFLPMAFHFPAGLGEMHVHADLVALRDLLRL